MEYKKKIMRLGDLLILSGKITKRQLNEALNQQELTGQKLGEILVEREYINERDIINVLEQQMGITQFDIQKYVVDPDIPRLISENLARRYFAIPVRVEGNKLTVAMNDPLNIFAIDDIEMATEMKVEPVLTSKQDIINAIDQYFGKQSAEKAIEDFTKQYSNEYALTEENEEISNDIKNAPVVRLINSLIRQALKSRASDIHIEPYDNIIRIRFRIDGKLQEIMTPSKKTHSAIITRIKIIAGLNIAEKRLPQDGRVEMNIDGGVLDLRVSVLPTVYGEKVVIRLLDRKNFLKSKKELGFTNENLKKFNSLLSIPNGILLVTGPTGSGKTTTLYTVLNDFNKIDTNIITVEDPVEYRLDGINQVQVNNKAGLTFSNGLRSILRQDPDIIMIGEIRDAETAQIAVRAAITGHIVISTMHTNDAPSTIMRLADMNIQDYLISTSVKGIIAQRLVRKICDNCKTSYKITQHEKEILNIEDDVVLYTGTGCSSCYNTGYKGRTAIHEVMKITGEIRDFINKDCSVDKIRESAINDGMITLQQNCKELVLNGITTVDELLRVTYTLEE